MPLKTALIGVGHMGRIHLQKLLSFEGVSLSALVDVDKAAWEPLSMAHCIQGYSDYREIPGNLDGVIVASPTESHYEITRYFLEKGTHVFLEKPITTGETEARELIELAHRRALVLQIGHLERLNPPFREALSFIRKPILIEASRLSPYTGRSTDVDVILDLMIHDIDLVLAMAQSEVTGIRAYGTALVTPVLDVARAVLDFADGSVATLAASRVSAVRQRSLTVVEKDRTCHVDLLSGTLSTIRATGQGRIETEERTFETRDPVRDELKEFIDSVKGDRQPTVKGEDGLKALLLADLIKNHIVSPNPTLSL
jgi:predicted dehydrogenase